MDVEPTGRRDPELSPLRCAECGQELPANAPEPCWCSQCGRLFSRQEALLVSELDPGPGVPPTVPLTPEERRRYRFVFWLVFLFTPIGMFLIAMVQRSLVNWMPAMLRDTVGVLLRGALPLLGTLAAGCLTAGGCLTRLRRPRLTGTDLWLNALSFGFLIFVIYLGLAFVGCTVLGSLLRIM